VRRPGGIFDIGYPQNLISITAEKPLSFAPGSGAVMSDSPIRRHESNLH